MERGASPPERPTRRRGARRRPLDRLGAARRALPVAVLAAAGAVGFWAIGPASGEDAPQDPAAPAAVATASPALADDPDAAAPVGEATPITKPAPTIDAAVRLSVGAAPGLAARAEPALLVDVVKVPAGVKQLVLRVDGQPLVTVNAIPGMTFGAPLRGIPITAAVDVVAELATGERVAVTAATSLNSLDAA